MISLLIVTFYLVILLFYIITSFFIAYHLIKFSLVSEIKIVMIVLFVLVSAGLIFSNLILFFSISWEDLLYQLNF